MSIEATKNRGTKSHRVVRAGRVYWVSAQDFAAIKSVFWTAGSLRIRFRHNGGGLSAPVRVSSAWRRTTHVEIVRAGEED